MLGLSLRRATAMTDVRLRGRRCLLRAPSEADWQNWADLRRLSRGFLTPWEPTWSMDALTREAYRHRLKRYGESWRADEGYAFFIFRTPAETLTGGLTLSNLRRGVIQSVSLGYWVGQPFAGQGIMSDALTAVLPFCFETLGLNRVEAATLPHNAASRRVLVKSGFTEEGYARQYLCIDGRWQDHVLFGITAEDYRAQRRGRLSEGAPASTAPL